LKKIKLIYVTFEEKLFKLISRKEFVINKPCMVKILNNITYV